MVAPLNISLSANTLASLVRIQFYLGTFGFGFSNPHDSETNYIQDEVPAGGPGVGPGGLPEGFQVYWNVPSFQCHKYGLNFTEVTEAWGVMQNGWDQFRGERIAILYDPGEFPALLSGSHNSALVPRNGGVPQEGNLARHLQIFGAHVDKLIPDENFAGLGVIDFEHWRPVWRQNWGSLNVYREFSRGVEKRRHPFWFSYMTEREAIYRYQLNARVFMLETLRLAKKLRPRARWGYYGYPFCFNYTPKNNRAACSDDVLVDNDEMQWLFSETTGFFPSLYLRDRGLTPAMRVKFMKGRLEEATRIAKNTPVFPYIWYKYHDTNEYLRPEDMINSIMVAKEMGARGVVVWGSSKDVRSETRCLALAEYLDTVLGPAAASATRLQRPTTTQTEVTITPTSEEETTAVVDTDNTIQRSFDRLFNLGSFG